MVELLAQGQATCPGCGVALAIQNVSKAAPENVIVTCATSCLEVTTSIYPNTAWKVPWIHTAFENVSATASGIEAAIKKLGKKWKVLAIAGDGGTADIGIQALSGMLERGHKVTLIMVDNEAYMNTGIQRSGATPFGAWTTTSPPGKKSKGKVEWKKPVAEIVAAHRIPYVATASVAYPSDLITKMKKAFEKQPSFVHIHCPCPPGWKMGSGDTVTVGKLAVESGMWVLYEIEDGVFRITKRVTDKKPIKDYLKMQGRFKHLTDEDTKEMQKRVNSEWERFEKLEKFGKIF